MTRTLPQWGSNILEACLSLGQRHHHHLFVTMKTETVGQGLSTVNLEQTTYTLDEALDTFGLGRFQIFIIAIGGLAYTADSMEIMVLSFLGPIMKCQYQITPDEEASMTMVVFIGMCIGAYVFGIMSDLYGRKLGALSTALMCTFGGIGSAFVQTYSALITVRFIVGLGMGGVPVAYSWVMEFVPSKERGKVGVIVQSFWTFGTVFQALVAWATLSSVGWRWMLIVTALPLLVMLSLFCYVPESPRYLLAKGEQDKAVAIVAKIADYNNTTLPNGSLHGRQKSKVEQQEQQSTLCEKSTEIFFGKNQHDTILLLVIWFSNACCYYGTVLLTTELLVLRKRENEGSGGEVYMNTNHTCVGTSCDILCSDVFEGRDFGQILVSALGETPGMLLTLVIVDRLGRRLSQTILFFIGALLVIILGCVARSETGDSIILFLLRAIYIGTFTVVYIYTPERYSTKVRSTAMGFLVAFSRFGGMLSPFISQAAPDQGAVWVPFVFYSLLSIAAGTASYKLNVETAGARLDEMTLSTTPSIKFGTGDGLGEKADTSGPFQKLNEPL